MDIDARWTLIGELIERHGTDAEKVAWAMCRGDYGERRMDRDAARALLVKASEALDSYLAAYDTPSPDLLLRRRYREGLRALLARIDAALAEAEPGAPDAELRCSRCGFTSSDPRQRYVCGQCDALQPEPAPDAPLCPRTLRCHGCGDVLLSAFAPVPGACMRLLVQCTTCGATQELADEDRIERAADRPGGGEG